MVRLELSDAGVIEKAFQIFQFLNGTIRIISESLFYFAEINFNS